MNHKFFNYFFGFIFIYLSQNLNGQKNTISINDFPKPNKGFKIESIQFPKLDNEFDFRIELLIGFDSITDCNHYVLNGNIEERELLTYKNSYYVVDSDFSIVPKKNKACFIDPIDTFIAMKSFFLPYNSTLPFVFILPNRMYIKYRIFRTTDFVPLSNYKIE
jgi:ecotin